MNIAVGSSYGIKVLTVFQPVPMNEYSYASSKLPKENINMESRATVAIKLAYKMLSVEENSITEQLGNLFDKVDIF